MPPAGLQRTKEGSTQQLLHNSFSLAHAENQGTESAKALSSGVPALGFFLAWTVKLSGDHGKSPIPLSYVQVL